MRQTVLLTGSTGFLGSHLVKRLLQEGHQPIVLKRSFSDVSRLVDVLPQLRCYNLDECDLKVPFQQCGPVDAVIHVATNYGVGDVVLSEVSRANTLFPLQLLETASAFQTPIFFNTDSYFNSGNVPYEYKYLPAYSLSKKHFVDWGKQMSEQEKIRFVNIKLHHMFGSGDSDSKFTSHVFKSCLEDKELKLTPGEQERDFIFVDDVVSAYLILLQKAGAQKAWYQNFDVGRGEAVSVRAFVEAVHRITGSQTALRFGALPYREHEIMRTQADTAPLHRLGWKPKHSVEEGICQTVAWYRQRQGEGHS